jgi:DNA-binding IclR family transcriptional regulator
MGLTPALGYPGVMSPDANSLTVSNSSSDPVEKSAHSGGVQSVDRAITLLELLAQDGESGVTDLAGEIGVHKSTVFRLLASLESRGYVEQTEDRGKYRLGFGVVRLAGAVAGDLSLSHQAQSICEALAAEVGETVNVAVLQEHFAVNVEQTLGPSALTTQNWVGQLTPLHATSSGKVLLAHLTPEHRNEVLQAAEALEAFTPHTVTEPATLEKQLAEILERGYAMVFEEYEVGLNAIAAPIFGRDGSVVAALSTSGPTFRLDAERIGQLVPTLLQAAKTISTRMGYFGTPRAT